MKRLVLFSLILLFAVSAFGQTATVLTLPRVMRGEGQTEAVLPIVISFPALSFPTGFPLANTTLTLVFSAPVTAAGGPINNSATALNINSNAVVCNAVAGFTFSTSTFLFGTVPGPGNTVPTGGGTTNLGCGPAAGGGATVSASGQVVTVSFGASATAIASGDVLVIQNIRVDATTVAQTNPTVTVTLASGGASGATPIPLPPPSPFSVGLVVPKSFTSTGAGTAFTSAFVNAPITIKTCTGATATNTTNTFASNLPSGFATSTSSFVVAITENFPQAFTSTGTESALTPGDAVNNGVRFTITVSGVPAGVTVTPFSISGAAAANGSGTGPFTLPIATTSGTLATGVTLAAANSLRSVSGGTGTGASSFPGQVVSTGSDIVYTIQITSESQTVTETVLFGIDMTGTPTVSAVGAPAVTETVALAPIGGTNIVRFGGPNTTLLSAATVANAAACNTALLFPFVISSIASGFDTSISVANTGADFVSSTVGLPTGQAAKSAQAGTCQFVGWNVPAFDGSAGTATNPGTTVKAIAPGGVFADAMSTGPVFAPLLGAAGFAGYVVANCQFPFGHGFAFITNNLIGIPTVSMGYLPLILPLSRTAAASFESLGN